MCRFVCSKYREMYRNIEESSYHKLIYRVKSMLKFKINVNLPRLLCIVVSAALNGEFERFGGLCVNCYYMTCYYVILSTLSVRKFWFAIHPFDLVRSKISISRLSVRPHPFEKFKKPFIRSKISISRLPIDLIRSKNSRSRLSVQPHPFENFN